MINATLKGVGTLAVLVAGTSAFGQINETQKITASDGAAGDEFGIATAIDGTTAVVGAPEHNGSAGAAYVYERTGSTFSEVVKLAPGDLSAGDRFGHQVDIEDDILIIGAPEQDGVGADSGSAYVFIRSGTTWVQQAKLTPADTGAGDLFGHAVGVDGTQVAVGAPEQNGFVADTGAGYVFGRTGTVWTQQTKLIPLDGNTGDQCGYALGYDGEVVALGAPSDDDLHADAGSCYIFEQIIPGFWSQDAKVTAGVPAAGEAFGSSVAVVNTVGIDDGDRVAVGAPFSDFHIADGGTVTIFEPSTVADHGWLFLEQLPASNTDSGAEIGTSVAIDFGSVLGGASQQDSAEGSTYFWADKLGSLEQELDATDGAAGDELGSGTAVSGLWAVSGARFDDDKGTDAGAAYIHRLTAYTNYCSAGTSANGCKALLSATGTPSASETSGFTLSAAGVEGAKDGLYFFGTNGKQANSWGSGTSFQCVVPPVARGGLLSASGTNGLCDGSFAQDLNALWCPSCPKPAKNPGAGSIVDAQLWYRDPFNTSNQTTSLSNAIEFYVYP
jgi:hypothetical protein